jgi:hypothetical protein
VCRLYVDKKLLDEQVFFFDVPKNLKLFEAYIDRSVYEQLGKKWLLLHTNVLAKSVWLEHPELKNFSENNFDLLPGEYKLIELPQNINVQTFAEKLTVTCLNNLRYTR